ncbi:hypothetical protein CRE_30326 [Caenorhabditis remanei]|uniref:Uncharacterized protein n=1 Tax=Caenorhabditis remanei TaxID=31234 RepID=E3NT74_CAERE|nr:hypothetical protein CRE_30326 [Caenorhabditis remanei]
MLEDSILDENPEVGNIQLPPIPIELERIHLGGAQDPSVDSSVPRTNGADAEDGNILELDDLEFGDPSDQGSNAGDSVHSSILGESDSQEHEVPANQEIREGPLEFFVFPNGRPNTPSVDSIPFADDNLDGNPTLEAANVVEETANLAEIEALDIVQQLKQLPAILQELKNIASQLKANNTSSGPIDDASNFITKKDLEGFATKQDLESLVSKADFVERLPSADKWTEMVDRLAPLASLDGLSVMMGSILQQLRVLALTQRRLTRCQGKSILLGKKLLADGKVDRVKFLKTSHKITNVYNSLRSYIARKVTALEKESEMRDLGEEQSLQECDPLLPLEQLEHHQTLCPRRRQKKRSSGGGKAIEEKVAPSEALEVEEKFGYNVDRFLDPSAQQRPGRYVVLAKHVTQTSDSDEEPTPSKRQKISTDSNGIGEDSSAKEVGKVPIQKKKKKNAGGKKPKKAKKPIKEIETESVDSVKDQEAANIENPSGSTN